MDDATRLFDEMPEELDAARAALGSMVGDLTHTVLGLFSERAVTVGERIGRAGGDPLEVLVVFASTLRVLADGLDSALFDEPEV